MRLVLFCEASADFRITSDLVDRVLSEEGPSWVADLIGSYPEAVRTWIGEGADRPFFDLHHLAKQARDRNIRVPQGHFDGKAGAPDALMARTAFAIVRAMLKQATSTGGSNSMDAVFIVRDMDDQRDARRLGLAQAREEASRWVSFRIVLGCPDMEREAWVLAGFEPESESERKRLTAARNAINFCPCENAHRLRDKDEGAARSAKRILRELTAEDNKRETRCWENTPLQLLRVRGEESGLREFLDEVKEYIVPLCNKSGSIGEGVTTC